MSPLKCSAPLPFREERTIINGRFQTQLIALCRTLEKLDAATLQERFDALRRALDDPPASGLRGAWEAVKKAVTDAADWLARTLGGLFR